MNYSVVARKVNAKGIVVNERVIKKTADIDIARAAFVAYKRFAANGECGFEGRSIYLFRDDNSVVEAYNNAINLKG